MRIDRQTADPTRKLQHYSYVFTLSAALLSLGACAPKEETVTKYQDGNTSIEIKTTEQRVNPVNDGIDRGVTTQSELERRADSEDFREPGRTVINAPFAHIDDNVNTGRTRVRAPFISVDTQNGNRSKSTIVAPFVKIETDGDDIHIKAPIVKRLLRKLED